MKKLCLVLAAIIITLSNIYAQTPSQFKYQAVLRNVDGTIIANQQKTVVIDILQGSSNGASVFTESHNITTSAQGTILLNIGSVNTTGLGNINWNSNVHFIKITVDGIELGTSQLLSVPYALQAKNVENVDYSQITNTPNLTNYITSETDPLFSSKFDINGVLNGDLLKFDGLKFVKFTPNYLTNFTEADPIFSTKFDFEGATTGDLLKFDGNKFVKFTPDYAINNHIHIDATTSNSGFMSTTDKTKLEGLQNADGSETKLSAGTNITITGNGTSANPYVVNANNNNNAHYLGEEYLDGIIFFLYTGSDGQQHGLVISKSEVSGAQWQSTTSTTGATRTEDGSYNTSLMSNSPAKNTITSLGAGWYIPSIDELNLIWNNRFIINKVARSIGTTLLSTTDAYWSSTEFSSTGAYTFEFKDGIVSYDNLKNYGLKVRGVRKF